jgi:hypothetical protein
MSNTIDAPKQEPDYKALFGAAAETVYAWWDAYQRFAQTRNPIDAGINLVQDSDIPCRRFVTDRYYGKTLAQHYHDLKNK